MGSNLEVHCTAQNVFHNFHLCCTLLLWWTGYILCEHLVGKFVSAFSWCCVLNFRLVG